MKIAEATNNKLDEANALIELFIYHFPDYIKQIELLLGVNTIIDEINPASKISLVSNADLGEVYIRAAEHRSGAEKDAYMQKAETCLLRAKSPVEKNNSTGYLAEITKIFVDL